MRSPHLFVPVLLGLALPLVTPSQARACGGTFCDNTAIPMPVDQRGEDILFVQDGPDIEVHVRIEYEGEAERFAWLVPIQAVPEISVGSEYLFAALADATAPDWTRSHDYECPDEDPSGNTVMGFVPESDFAAASEDPDIVLEATVGVFDVVVLQGGTAAEVIEFLQQNDYAQDAEAEPILQEYLDEDFLFAAVKLTADASTDSIHPLVFRFPGDEPCVPIRLTRIAAEQDMGIRAYFLGQERWAPLNYQHVVLNPLAFPWSEVSWQSSLPEYTELLTLAVDEAGGRAFATDYAGDSSVVETWSLYSPAWDEAAFVGLNMIEALDQIAIQSLNTHALIQPLLLEFMPPPDGVDPQDFWNNIEEYIDLVDIDAWDSAGFAAALAERIIDPGLHAVDLVEIWPYLTRLHTTMSPHEMTVDPMFQPAPALGDVSNELVTQSLDLCGDDAGERYKVPFGMVTLPVCLDESQQWPTKLQGHAARRIEQIPPMGPPQVLEDFTAAILSAHAAHQLESACADSGDDEGNSDEGDSDEGDEGGATEGGGETSDASLVGGGNNVGCSCRSNGSGASPGTALGLLGLASLVGGWRRRRQRPHF
jgi:MYXO-CTERM domain-containing protein